MKNTTVILAILLAFVCSLLAFRYNQSASQAKEGLDRERYTRMVAEEKLEDANSKIGSLNTELSRTQDKLKGIESKLEQTLTMNGNLKSRLDKASSAIEELKKKIAELGQISGVIISIPEIGI